MKMKVLIAEDERHIRTELEYMLSKHDNVELVAICEDGKSALENVIKFRPDIVFLDILMPEVDGITLGKYIKQMKKFPYIIYLTAFNEHAIEAVRIGAREYLLKPFSQKDIDKAIQDAYEFFEHTMLPEQRMPIRIAGYMDDKLTIIDQDDIVYIEALNKEVFISTNDARYICKLSLSKIEEKLNMEIFFRCHRNYIINVLKIHQITPWFNASYMVIMKDKNKSQIPVSRNNVQVLKKGLCI
jgi:DNA-binding LytR/AlgR family response regulator